MIFQFFFFNKSAKMSTILCFSVNMGCCVYINEEKKLTNDFSKWLQYNRVKTLRGSEYFPYPLYVCMYIYIYIYIYIRAVYWQESGDMIRITIQGL